jgi:4-amino-4-deoxy-L-arabinose transferase-like glycosyltransferase
MSTGKAGASAVAAATQLPRARSTALRASIVITVVTLATTLPFANRAIHIDEVYFVEVAQNILKDPLRPYAGAVGLEDIDYRAFAASGRRPNTFAAMSHPPLVPYVMAATAWFTGRFSELWLHLAFVPFALLAGLAGYALARRFTAHPLAAALLLVCAPIFTLSAQGMMTDMPAFALSLAALALLVDGIDRERRWIVVLAGLLAGFAIVTRYTSVMVVPLFLLYGFSRRRLRGAFLSLIGISGVVGVWETQNLMCHGQLHLLASLPHYRLFYQAQSFDWIGLTKKPLGDFSALGGTAFAAGMLLLRAGALRRWISFGAAALAATMLFLLRPRGIERLETYTPVEIAAVALCFGLGVVLLVEALRPLSRQAVDALPRRGRGWGDQGFLIVWLLMAVGGAILFLPFATARYMLPTLPPLLFLLVRRAESLWAGRRWLRIAFTLVVAQSLLLGALLSLADYEYAGCYRDLARSVRADYPNRPIWFVGEWGFRYYMGTQGGRYLRSSDEDPQSGDIIVRPSIAGMHEMSEGVRQRAERLREIDIRGRWPVRLMSFEAKAGYYSQHWGYLPFAFSRAPMERVEILEVRTPAPAVEP